MTVLNVTRRGSAFLRKVADTPELPHSAVRLGAWLCALHDRLELGTIEMHKSNFMSGVRDLSGKVVQVGLPTRYKTIAEALESLQKHDMLKIEEGEVVRGFPVYRFTMKV